MLRLIGRKGDGWLPTLGRMTRAEFAAANATIDEAALAAGRDPRDIRRLANIGGTLHATGSGGGGTRAVATVGFLDGPATQWVDQLLPLVIDHGVGTFILSSDEPDTIQRFAAEVAPALRESVADAMPLN